jgi:hypothetical protein
MVEVLPHTPHLKNTKFHDNLQLLRSKVGKFLDNSLLYVKVPAFVRLGSASCGPPSGWWAYTFRMQRVCSVPNKQVSEFTPSKSKQGCDDGLVAALLRPRGSANQRVRVPPAERRAFRVQVPTSFPVTLKGCFTRTHRTLLTGSEDFTPPKQGLSIPTGKVGRVSCTNFYRYFTFSTGTLIFHL